MRLAIGAVAATALLLLGAYVVAAAAPKRESAVQHTVTIEATSFTPAQLTVKVGDTITWINKDPFPHTATSREGAFDSKTIEAGKSWRWRATRRGEFGYVCAFHPTMKGIVRVE